MFLYRFLQENLLYITTMLAMRPPPLVFTSSTVPGEEAGKAPEGEGFLTSPSTSQQMQRTPSQPTKQQQEQEQTAALSEQQQQQPFVLAMDVEMSAPVISMPRSSNSGDAIEVDLGVLRLITTVSGGGKNGGDEQQPKAPPAASLLENAKLTFSGVGLTVVQAGHRGHSVVKNPEQGWKLGWKRPLLPLERGDAPYVSYIYFLNLNIFAFINLLLFTIANTIYYFLYCMFSLISSLMSRLLKHLSLMPNID